jgi:hypothetical protein
MSKPETIITSKVVDHWTLVLDQEDGSEPKKWKLCYDYRGIAKAEQTTGLNLLNLDDWKKVISPVYFPQVVWAGLNRFNPDVTLEEVQDVLNPEAQDILAEKILFLLHPTVKSAMEKFRAEKATGATADPNPPAAPQSV